MFCKHFLCFVHLKEIFFVTVNNAVWVCVSPHGFSSPFLFWLLLFSGPNFVYSAKTHTQTLRLRLVGTKSFFYSLFEKIPAGSRLNKEHPCEVHSFFEPPPKKNPNNIRKLPLFFTHTHNPKMHPSGAFFGSLPFIVPALNSFP